VDLETILKLVAFFNEQGVEYVIVGGVAVNFQGLARATADVDVFVAPSAENIERLRRALNAMFDDPSIEEITVEDLAGDYPAVQYVPPDGTFHIDILTRLGEAFAYSDIEAEELEIDGVRVRVATPQMLYRMKRDTVRMVDKADAERIKKHYNLDEE
jgi:predicted nucleotidyltransferase